MDPSTQQRLLEILEVLSEDQYHGKGLVGPLKGRYSWRVGSYRIIYQVIEQQKQINVITINYRKKIYKKL